MNEATNGATGEVDWAQLRPVLDDAMRELGERDREAVVLRFLARRPFAEIGRALHVSEDAARMRVERALDRLRALLVKRGISSTASALSAVMTSQGAVAAPASLSATIAVGALSGALEKSAGWLAVIFMNKLKVGGALAVLAALGGILVVQQRELDGLHLAFARLEWPPGIMAVSRPRSDESTRPLAAKLAAAVLGAGPSAAEWAEYQALSDLQGKGAIDETYAALFAQLRLPPEKVEALKELMLERRRHVTESRVFLTQNGVSIYQPEFEPWARKLLPAARQETDEQIRDLLGKEGAEEFAAFERQLVFRGPIDEMSRYLRFIDPLDYARRKRLLGLIEQALPDVDAAFADGPYVIPDAVVTRAAEFLSPVQLTALRYVQLADAAGREMHEMNWEAAASGRIRLSERNKLHYPSQPQTGGEGSP